ncbi:acyltransferase family protein, partial [Yersinia sp. 1252 StPb PI]|uniref:acyltransferase family protein n=1 Tax=Yersinia sp. 1252 StPb PI TaxID=3117404 RepID=UPI003B289F72
MKMQIMPEEQYRRAINYVKAIGIIAVVAGHYYGTPFNVYTPYVWHMPLFFFLGGMLFNSSKPAKKAIRSVIRNYFLYLIIVFVIIG